MNIDEFERKLIKGENDCIEFKESSNRVSEDIWETISAFANTNGGFIFLGVKEENGEFIPIGVSNADKLIKDFWNMFQSAKHVSEFSLSTDKVRKMQYKEKFIIIIEIPCAAIKDKPVYIFGDTTKVYKRLHCSDYLCNSKEIQTFIGAKHDSSDDLGFVESLSIEELDILTIDDYIKRVITYKGIAHSYAGLSRNDFLENINAIEKKEDQYYVTKAGLLMFGKTHIIRRHFPHYDFNYLEYLTDDARWSDRVEIDNSWGEGNLYNFYLTVVKKMAPLISRKFEIDNDLIRRDGKDLDTFIREGLINSLVHLNINDPKVKIEVFKDKIIFNNSGLINIDKKYIFKKKKSNAKNPILMKMFRNFGVSEEMGTGLYEIKRVAEEFKLTPPYFENNYDEFETILILNFNSLIDKKVFREIKMNIGEIEFENLSVREKEILALIYNNYGLKNAGIKKYLDIHSYDLTNILTSLEKKKFIFSSGKNKGKKYYFNGKRNVNGFFEKFKLNEKEKEDFKKISKGTFRVTDFYKVGLFTDIEIKEIQKNLYIYGISKPVLAGVSTKEGIKKSIKEHKELTSRSLAYRLGVSQTTITRALKGLLEEGFILKEGNGVKVTYIYNEKYKSPKKAKNK